MSDSHLTPPTENFNPDRQEPISTAGIKFRPFDLSVFPDNWVRYPFKLRPLNPTRGLHNWVGRRIVATAFPPRVYVKAGITWTNLKPNDRWLAAISRWTRMLHALRLDPNLRGPISYEQIRRMIECHPPGWLFRLPDVGKRPWRNCKYRYCPYCHAHRAMAAYNNLLVGYKKRPKKTKVYVVGLFGSGFRTALQDRVRKLRLAGAVGFCYPNLAEPGLWHYQGVGLTDDRTRAPGCRVRLITRRFQLASAIAGWLRFPCQWGVGNPLAKLRRVAQVHADRGLERGSDLKFWCSLGCCRDDYVPGKGLLDYAGHETVLG